MRLTSIKNNEQRYSYFKHDLVRSLLQLSPIQVSQLDKNIINNLTPDQLQEIYTSGIINLPLSLRIRDEDRVKFANRL